MPDLIVLAGCNGAGKTTASRSLLAETLKVTTFVNADAIAQGLSGFAPETAAVEAGRIMLERLRSLAEQRVDFAFETTLSGRTLEGWLRQLQTTGYFVHLYYFCLVNRDLAVARVAQRVRQGGHDIPEATIRRRFGRSLKNFFAYGAFVDSWRIYDNTWPGTPNLIEKSERAENSTDGAISRAMKNAVLSHARDGHPVATWRDGKVVWVTPEEVFALLGDQPLPAKS